MQGHGVKNHQQVAVFQVVVGVGEHSPKELEQFVMDTLNEAKWEVDSVRLDMPPIDLHEWERMQKNASYINNSDLDGDGIGPERDEYIDQDSVVDTDEPEGFVHGGDVHMTTEEPLPTNKHLSVRDLDTDHKHKPLPADKYYDRPNLEPDDAQFDTVMFPFGYAPFTKEFPMTHEFPTDIKKVS